MAQSATRPMEDAASEEVQKQAEMSHCDKMLDIYGTDRTEDWSVRYNRAIYGR